MQRARALHRRIALIPPPHTKATDQRLCIAAGLDVLVLSADEILVQFGSRSHPSELFRDSDMTGLVGRAVGRLLEGPATLAELVAVAGSKHEHDVQAFVQTLVRKGILVPEATDSVAQYLAYATGGSSHLDRHVVAVVGCGPLGARIAASLAEHGVGSILLADDRQIDEHWRRFAPTGLAVAADGAGRAAHALADWLAGAGHSAERLDEPLERGGLERAVERSDLSVLALEHVDLRLGHLLNRHAVQAARPWLHAVVDGNCGVVGPLFSAPETACYNEFQTLRTAATPSAAMMRRYRMHVLEVGGTPFFPGLPAYADLVAAYAALATVHYLLRGSCFAFGRAMFVNFEQMVIDTDDVLRLPRCPVCSERRPARPLYSPPASAT